MEIKNLSQLKKALSEGHEFRIVEHFIKPEYNGQIRKVNKMQTNGMYTIVPNDPTCKENTCNYGKGMWCDFGKASEWKFENGKCTYTPKFKVSGEELVTKPVWTIEVI